MGRPKVHDATTRDELLAAAELLIAERGIDAVTIRDVAARAGTTTRAVYVLFGSKEQLLEALARRGFELLMSGIAAVPPSDDPARDLVNRSVKGFRPFALEHPDLFRLFLTPQSPAPVSGAAATESRLAAYGQLVKLVERVQRAGLLGATSVEEATVIWDALCTGLALREVCGPIRRADGERIWTKALQALLRGLEGEPKPADTGGVAARSRPSRSPASSAPRPASP